MKLSDLVGSMLRLVGYGERLGLQGIRLLAQKKKRAEQIVSFRFKNLPHPIWLRTATSDIATFHQVFIEEQYKQTPSTNPQWIIDCGANIGLASLYFANKYPNARIVAIEPESSNFEMLLKNIKPYPNITALQKGVWRTDGNLIIEDNGLDKWGFTVKEIAQPTSDSIEATSIPSVMKEFGIQQIGILKIDVEGSEKEIFEADCNTWLQKTDHIIIELHDRMKHGTAKAFFSAINNMDYDLEIGGENLFINLSKS